MTNPELTIPASVRTTAVAPGYHVTTDGLFRIDRTVISSACTGGAPVTYWTVTRLADGTSGDCVDTLAAAKREIASGYFA